MNANVGIVDVIYNPSVRMMQLLPLHGWFIHSQSKCILLLISTPHRHSAPLTSLDASDQSHVPSARRSIHSCTRK